MSLAIAATTRNAYAGFVQAVRPVVFVDGVPEPGLSVKRYSMASETQEPVAELLWSSPDQARPQLRTGQAIAIAVPYLLADGETRWQCLIEGQAVSRSDGRDVGRDDSSIEVIDALTALMREPSDVVGPWPEAGQTLHTIFSRMGSILGSGCLFALDEAVLEKVVEPSNGLTQRLGELLRPVLELEGLIIDSVLEMHHGSVRRSLALMPAQSARRVVLPWPDETGEGGAVASVVLEGDQQPPRAWIAQGGRPVVEDTFALQAGWDPSLEGQADSEYGRLTSSDFSRFGPVYRAWVLNEDGAYREPPFGLATFDAGALFGESGSIDERLRFVSCVATDTSGRSIPPVIESSTDSGTTWSAYPGQARVMADRAGVLLEDDDLPSMILAAAKAGTLRLRITASLRSPDPIEARRWDGNPFAGSAPSRLLRFGDAYRWQRIAGTSIHASSVATGALPADLVDDRSALRAALYEQVNRLPGAERVATLKLAGAWVGLAAGDRVDGVLGNGLRIDATPTRFLGREARITQLTIDFGVGSSSPRTTLRLE